MKLLDMFAKNWKTAIVLFVLGLGILVKYPQPIIYWVCMCAALTAFVASLYSFSEENWAWGVLLLLLTALNLSLVGA